MWDRDRHWCNAKVQVPFSRHIRCSVKVKHTRMHSSRMHTARALTALACSLLRGGGGEVCLPGGRYLTFLPSYVTPPPPPPPCDHDAFDAPPPPPPPPIGDACKNITFATRAVKIVQTIFSGSRSDLSSVGIALTLARATTMGLA